MDRRQLGQKHVCVVFGRSGYHDEPTPFLAIAESYISMDWDDRFVDIDPSHMAISKGQLTAWNKRIVDVLTMLGLVGEGFEVPPAGPARGKGSSASAAARALASTKGTSISTTPRWQLTTFY